MTGDVTEHDATTPGHRRTQLCVRRAVSGVGSRLAWVENTSLTPVSSHLGTAFRDAPGFAHDPNRGAYTRGGDRSRDVVFTSRDGGRSDIY